MNNLKCSVLLWILFVANGKSKNYCEFIKVLKVCNFLVYRDLNLIKYKYNSKFTVQNKYKKFIKCCDTKTITIACHSGEIIGVRIKLGLRYRLPAPCCLFFVIFIAKKRKDIREFWQG